MSQVRIIAMFLGYASEGTKEAVYCFTKTFF